jgi:2,3-bisphosphoglycerate-independent phosphoglycerate mutase
VDDQQKRTIKNGKLGDLAPTILGLIGLAVPPEMTGNNLIGN